MQRTQMNSRDVITMCVFIILQIKIHVFIRILQNFISSTSLSLINRSIARTIIAGYSGLLRIKYADCSLCGNSYSCSSKLVKSVAPL